MSRKGWGKDPSIEAAWVDIGSNCFVRRIELDQSSERVISGGCVHGIAMGGVRRGEDNAWLPKVRIPDVFVAPWTTTRSALMACLHFLAQSG